MARLFSVPWIVESLGIKRRLTALLQTIAVVASSSPLLYPYVATLDAIAAWLGITGLVHAGASKALNKSPLSTWASLLGALNLAVHQIPQLAPFADLVHWLTSLVSLFAAGSIIGGGKG